MDDDGHAISYRLLERGVPVHASDGERLGTVSRVLEASRDDIFDGIVMDTPAGERFVDAPEVARITERRVTLSITETEAAELPPPDQGAPEFKADPRSGRVGRFFGGGWKRR